MPVKGKLLDTTTYKDISEVYLKDGRTVNAIYAPVNGHYELVYNKANERTKTGTLPLTFTDDHTNGTNLTDYRIYGQTVDGESVGDRTGNLFDMKKFAETCNQIYATVNYINNTLTFTATNVDAYVNAAYNKGMMIYVADRPSCIDVLPSTTYTISMSSAPKCFISWVNSSYKAVSEYEQIPANQSYTFTTPEDCTKLLIRFGKHVTNIGDTFTISNIMLNAGSTALPYEPYGYKVPVTVSDGTDTLTTPIYLPEPIKMVGDEAEYIDYGEQKFVKKFYKITLNFDDMNNDETYPGWSGGTAVVEYCNKIRSLAINTPNGYMPFQYSSISNFKAIISVRDNRSILFLGASFDIGHTQSVLKEIYAGRSITFILKIPDTVLDVTLPALPTLPGTNVLSVGTEVQPSKIDITGHIKTISGGS